MWTPRWVSMVGIRGLKFCGSCEIPTMMRPPFCGSCARAGRALRVPAATAPPKAPVAAMNCRRERPRTFRSFVFTQSSLRRSVEAQARVERVAQPIAREVEAEYREADHRARVDRHPRGVEHIALRIVQHVAPARGRGLDAVAKIAQRRFEQYGRGHRE